MDLRACLDRFGISRPDRDSIPGSSSPYSVATPTELSHRDGRKLKSTSKNTDTLTRDLICVISGAWEYILVKKTR